MKKLFILLSIVFITTSAVAGIYRTTCGIIVASLDQKDFPKYEDWYTYCQDLNEGYCGTRNIKCVTEISDEDYTIVEPGFFD
jgi:hypothetical protein